MNQQHREALASAHDLREFVRLGDGPNGDVLTVNLLLPDMKR